MVAELSIGRRRCLGRDAGGIGSENADISNIKRDENTLRRKSKVSCPT